MKTLYERAVAQTLASQKRATGDLDQVEDDRAEDAIEEERHRNFQSWLRVARACAKHGWFWPGED